MPIQSQTTLKALGLNINPNFLDLPNGSLVQANDVIIRRENVIESRRGMSNWSQLFGDPSSQLLEYKGRLLSNNANNLFFDTGLTDSNGFELFDRFDGTYSPPGDYRMRYVESNKNLYFTTSDGIKKISAVTASDFTTATGYIQDAGAVKAIDFTANLVIAQGQINGFLPVDSAVSYRTLWGYKDVNQNLILGSPSASNSVYNFLTNALVMDLNTLLTKLDLIGSAGSLINNENYYANYALALSASGNSISNNLTNLATQIDNNLLYGNSTGSGAPLTISTIAMNLGGTVTVNFSSGNPSLYISPNDYIQFNNLQSTLTTTSETITSVSAANPTVITTSTPIPGLVNGQTVTIAGVNGAIPLPSGQYVVSNVSGSTFTIPVDVTTPGTGGTASVTTGSDLSVFNNASLSTPGFQILTVGTTSLTFQYTFPSGVTPYTISGVTANSGTPVNSTATLNSYNYTHIIMSGDDNFPTSLNSTPVGTPSTSGENATMQDVIQRIVNRLKVELPAVISATLITEFIDPFTITQSADTTLIIDIPTDSNGNQLNSSYFLQVYRSAVFNAYSGTQSDTSVLGTTVIPDDELHQIFEYFPTAADYANGYVTFNDNYPDSLAINNTPLYTNPVTGDGINQSNDIPPFCQDMNLFFNVIFYANTKTRQTIPNFQLLGVDNIVSGDQITIGNDVESSTYTFIDGVNESTTFTLTASNATTLKAAIQNRFFTINSVNNNDEYFVRYRYDGTDITFTNVTAGSITTFTTTNPHNLTTGDSILLSNLVSTPTINGVYAVTVTGSNSFTLAITTSAITNFATATAVPYVANKTTVVVDLITGDTVALACQRTSEALNNLIFDFTSKFTSNTFTATVINAGIVASPTIGNISGSNLSFVITATGSGENAALGQVLISRTLSPAVNIDLTARSLIRVINRSTTSPVYAYYTSGTNSSPGQIDLESKLLADTAFYIIASGPVFNSGNNGIGNSFNPDISPVNVTTGVITNSATSGYVTFNATANGLQNGDQVIITNTDSTPAYNGVFNVANVTTNTFDVLVQSAPISVNGSHFSWEVTSDSVASTNNSNPNRLYYSKFNQPDAVPLLNYFDIGRDDKAILRIFPLRTSLFVFKEDGIYVVSGQTAPYTVQLFDTSCILSAPDTVDALDNNIYLWSTKGISQVNQSGTQEISKPVDIDLFKLATYPNYKTATWGIGYNSDNSYTVYTTAQPTDTTGTIGYRYCTLTNTWTNIIRNQTSGIVLSTNDLLYMGSGDVNIINQERKSYTRFDYADDNFELQLTAGSINNTGNILQLSSVLNISVGDVVLQTQDLTLYTFNNLLQQLDLETNLEGNYFSTLQANIGDNLRTSIVALAAKLDADPGTSTKTYSAHIADYTVSISDNSIADPTVITTTGSVATNLIDGRVVTITGTQFPQSIPTINGTFPVRNTGTWGTSDNFTVPVDVTTGGGTGLTFSTAPNSSSFADIVACYNSIIQLLNNDTGILFSMFQQVSIETPIEAVIISINPISKKVTLNIPLPWVIGPIEIYNSIPCKVIYAPLTFGDVLQLKQIFQATAMFSNTAFTNATLSFSSDLKPDFISQSFNNYGNGIFGSYSPPGFGFGYFGGGGNAKPFRTIIPLQTQRCRYINVQFQHQVAREIIELYGVTLSGNIQESIRGYR